jgi:hypothetical protein
MPEDIVWAEETMIAVYQEQGCKELFKMLLECYEITQLRIINFVQFGTDEEKRCTLSQPQSSPRLSNPSSRRSEVWESAVNLCFF